MDAWLLALILQVRLLQGLLLLLLQGLLQRILAWRMRQRLLLLLRWRWVVWLSVGANRRHSCNSPRGRRRNTRNTCGTACCPAPKRRLLLVKMVSVPAWRWTRESNPGLRQIWGWCKVWVVHTVAVLLHVAVLLLRYCA